MVRIGARVVRVVVFSAVVYIVIQTNVARNAFRGSTITPQLMHPSVFDGQKTTFASLAGKEVMPGSEFAKAWRFGNEFGRSFARTKGATPPR